MEDMFQRLKSEENFTREELERFRSRTQVTTSKSENTGADSSSVKKENHQKNQHLCKNQKRKRIKVHLQRNIKCFNWQQYCDP